MRIDDATWLGPTERLLAKRRRALKELDEETSRLPDIIVALRSGKGAQARADSRSLSKRCRRVVETGPISAVETRLEWAERSIGRCRASLALADREEAKALLLSQLPELTPPPGFDTYRRLESAELRFQPASLDEKADTLELVIRLEAHRYRFDWRLAGAQLEARALLLDSDLEAAAASLAPALAAATERLKRDGLEPFHDPGTPQWHPRAARMGNRFDPSRPVTWWIHFPAAGPTHGGESPGGGAWQGYGMNYAFRYETVTGDLELELRGWNT